jgi:hypothetical protein
VQNTYFTLSQRIEKLMSLAFLTALMPMQETGLLNQNEVWYMKEIYKKKEGSGRKARIKHEMKHGAVTSSSRVS